MSSPTPSVPRAELQQAKGGEVSKKNYILVFLTFFEKLTFLTLRAKTFVSMMPVRQHSLHCTLCLLLFWSEIVLEYILTISNLLSFWAERGLNLPPIYLKKGGECFLHKKLKSEIFDDKKKFINKNIFLYYN